MNEYEEMPEEGHEMPGDFTASALPQVQAISQRLVSQILEQRGRLGFDALRGLPVATADVEHNLDLLQQYVFQRRAQGQETIPCAMVGNEPIPALDDGGIDQARPPGRDAPTAPDGGTRLAPVRIERALAGTARQLTGFLATRLAAWGGMGRQRPFRPIPPPGLLTITVSSVSTGARVCYSPAYFINYLPLAAPSSPVTGPIAPGRYVFKLVQPGFISLYDPQMFDVPPHLNIALLV